MAKEINREDVINWWDGLTNFKKDNLIASYFPQRHRLNIMNSEIVEIYKFEHTPYNFNSRSEADVLGKEAGDEWLLREDHPDGFVDGELFHFLVCVTNSKVNHTYWEIITGYIDDSGSIILQCNDDDSGWVLTDAIYFKHITNLPPLP